tara:strand:+ start:550 stop:675 length:126 start_codon:yes stop_codon:yes gene_type:complete
MGGGRLQRRLAHGALLRDQLLRDRLVDGVEPRLREGAQLVR